MNIKTIFIIAISFGPNNCFTQNNILDSIILSNKYVIQSNGTEFSGEGIEFILEQSKDVQFLGLAENHNTKQIPVFTTYLFSQLHDRYSFNYLALEQDPVMMQLLSSRKYDPIEMAKEYQHGFTFITDQEVDMIKDCIDISSKTNPVWGCDQSFGASHALKQVMDKFKFNEDSYNSIKAIVDTIYVKEKVRDLAQYSYICDDPKTNELLQIRDTLIKYGASLELKEYMGHLITSSNIYSDYTSRNYYESVSAREYYMRDRFIHEFKKAEQIEPIPRVVLKFGHYHLMDGFNTGSNVNGIGNLIRTIAQYNNQKALVINCQIYRNDDSDWDYLDESYPEFTKHSDINSWTVFDLRPLRSGLNNGDFKGLLDKENIEILKELIYRYDLLLIIGNGGDGTWKYTNVKY